MAKKIEISQLLRTICFRNKGDEHGRKFYIEVILTSVRSRDHPSNQRALKNYRFLFFLSARRRMVALYII